MARKKTSAHLSNLFHAIFSTPEGKEALLHLAELGHLTRTHFDSDPILNALKEGERRMVLEIHHLAQINITDTIQQINNEYGLDTNSGLDNNPF